MKLNDTPTQGSEKMYSASPCKEETMKNVGSDVLPYAIASPDCKLGDSVMTNLDHALDLIQYGWPVFPCKPNKKPYTLHGFEDATTNTDEIHKWWNKWPEALVGVSCGPANLVVVDIDKKNTIDLIREKYRHWFETRRVRTGSGGLHLYFVSPANITIQSKNRGIEELPSTDIKTDGGYVIAAGRSEFGEYVTEEDRDPVSMPNDLLAILLRNGVASKPTTSKLDNNSQRVVDTIDITRSAEEHTSRHIEKASVGNRNETGFSLACQLRDLGLTEHGAQHYMLEYQVEVTNSQNPYTEAEALASLESVYGKPPRDPAIIGMGGKCYPGDLPGLFNLTDAGNAERLIKQYGDIIRYCPQLESWLIYDGKRWRPDDTGHIMSLAKDTLRKNFREFQDKNNNVKDNTLPYLLRSENQNNVRNMVQSAQYMQEIVVSVDMLDQDKMLLNVLNGTIDLRTGLLRPHDPRDLITMLASVEYRQGEDCPHFKAFVQEIFQGNDDLIRFVQRALGYSMTGETSERCIFIEYGNGANGKSTLNNVIMRILGDYHTATQAETLFEKKFGDGINNDVARLKGARYVTTSESNQGKDLDEGRVKQLTGGDPVTARFLHKEYFQFDPKFKIWLGTNHRPNIRGTDQAIWDRIRLIPFDVRIPPERQDKGLADTLYHNEGSGILNWMIEGCLSWQKDGLGEAEAVKTATQEYRIDMDLIIGFIEDVLDPQATKVHITATSTLYDHYKQWTTNTGNTELGQKQFTARMKEKGYEIIK
ncbi:MAG TPA: phage/plasmid primase, P4 family [Methanocella sp.]|nr:phage/plasmid primase, P4 family [Methanocella sp.]